MADNLEDLQGKIRVLNLIRTKLLDEHEDTARKLAANYDEIHKLSVRASEIKYQEGLKSGFNWADLLEHQVTEGNRLFKNQAMAKAVPSGHIKSQGFNPKTNQYGIEIKLDEMSKPILAKLAKFLEEEIIPVLRPTPPSHSLGVDSQEEPAKLIGLLEPSLASGGSHHIAILQGGVELRVIRHGSQRTLHTTKTFMEMLEHLQEKYSFKHDEY